MAKIPPKLLRYDGSVYELVPGKLRYHRATYVLAASPLKLPPVPEARPGEEDVGGLVGKELEKEEQEKKQVVREEQIKEFLQPLIDSLKAEIHRYLDHIGLKTSGEIGIAAIEYDGFDLEVPIAAGNFANLPGKTAVQFDYRVHVAPPEGVEVEEREELGLEEKGFFGRMLERLRRNLGMEGTQELEEVVVYLCNQTFVMPGKLAGNLLSSLAFFQDKSQVHHRPGDLLKVPELGATREDELEWLQAFIQRLFEAEYMRLIRERGGIRSWKSQPAFKELLGALVKAEVITEEQEEYARKVLDYVPDEEFKDFMEKSIKGEKPGAVAVTLTEKVERAVRKIIPAKEGYKGGVRVGLDEKEQKIVAGIDIQMVFVFDRSPGGRIRFYEAGAAFCQSSWIVDSVQAASQLVTAYLDLIDAKKNSMDAELSQAREETDQDKLVKSLLKEMEKLTGRERGERPLAEEVSEEEAIGRHLTMPGVPEYAPPTPSA